MTADLLHREISDESGWVESVNACPDCKTSPETTCCPKHEAQNDLMLAQARHRSADAQWPDAWPDGRGEGM